MKNTGPHSLQRSVRLESETPSEYSARLDRQAVEAEDAKVEALQRHVANSAMERLRGGQRILVTLVKGRWTSNWEDGDKLNFASFSSLRQRGVIRAASPALFDHALTLAPMWELNPDYKPTAGKRRRPRHISQLES